MKYSYLTPLRVHKDNFLGELQPRTHFWKGALYRYFLLITTCYLLLPSPPLMAGSPDDWSAGSSSSGPITVAIDQHYAPYEFVDKNGAISGFIPELLREISTLTGMKFQFKALSWPDVVAGLESGDIALVNMIKTPERQKKYRFSQPHSSIEQAIFCRRDGPIIDSVAALSGHQIALQKNDIALERLQGRTDFKRTLVHSKEEGFLLLHGGKVDAFLTAARPGLRFVANYELDDTVIGAMDLFPQELCFATMPDNNTLIEHLNRALEQIKENGRLTTLAKHWFGPRPEPVSWLDLHQASVFWSIVLAAGLLLLTIIWIVVLRTVVRRRSKELEDSCEQLKSEVQFRTLLLDSTAEAIYGLDTEGRCTFCNRAFLQMFGYGKAEEIVGQVIHSKIHDRRVDGSKYQFEECLIHHGFMDGQPTHSRKELFWRQDRSSFPAECWSHPIIKDGVVLGAVATVIDISKRLAAEEALQKSEELYRSLADNVGYGITLVDKDHTILMANTAQGRLFKKAPSSFVGKKCFQEFEKRDTVCTHCPGVAAMASDAPHDVITTGVRDNGDTFTVHIRAYPLHDKNGKATRFIEVVEDITEKIKSEQALAAEKERLAVTLRSIGDGVICTDTNGKVTLINKIAEELTGWTQSEAACRPLQDVFHIVNEKSGEICENPVQKVLNSGKIIGLANHTALIAKDGSQRSIADSGAPIFDKESQIIGVVLVFRDVTDQNRMETELLKIRKLESVGILAGGIAHDFNNILAAIIGNLSLARELTSTDSRIAPLLEQAEMASMKAKGLTQQLLTFARGGEPVTETTLIQNIIQETASFVLHGSNVALLFTPAPDLWPAEVDKGQISQVVQNIILNARHAMPEGGTIVISCSNISSEQEKPYPLKKRPYIKIIISDSGIGIPANMIEKVFDPYFTTKHEGSGLGLAITNSIISKHGGHIAVQSASGDGTTFTIYLPASPGEQTSQDQQPTTETLQNTSARILLMDDDEMVCTMVCTMLSNMGHKVESVNDGESAVRIYGEELKRGAPFDLVIMDLTIPGGMGGQEAVQKVLAIDPAAKVIVSSGYSNDPVMANYGEYGFIGYAVKPYQVQELRAVIVKALNMQNS